jgi:hypothetical protein
MLKLAADENFDNDIVRGAELQLPELDFLRVQDVGLTGAEDDEVLAWAASEGRVLLVLTIYGPLRARFSHDLSPL